MTKAAVAALGCDEKCVTVAVEDVNPGDWADKVYKPKIAGKAGKLYKKPWY